MTVRPLWIETRSCIGGRRKVIRPKGLVLLVRLGDIRDQRLTVPMLTQYIRVTDHHPLGLPSSERTIKEGKLSYS